MNKNLHHLKEPENTDNPERKYISPEEFEELIKDVPEDKRLIIKEMFYSKLISTSHTISHSGPLPSPQTLEGYEKIVPTSANRLIVMAEKQSNHRMNIEKEVITGQLSQSKLGQIFGFIIAVFALSLSFILSLYGHITVAGIIGGATVVGLVTVFVIGKRSQSEDLDNTE